MPPFLQLPVQILLLEAGGDETEISDVPALAAYLQLGRMDWKYKTEPQPNRASLGKDYLHNEVYNKFLDNKLL